MAARIFFHHCRGLVLSPPCASSRYRSSFTGPGAAFWKGQFIQFLSRYFYDINDINVIKNLSLLVKNRAYNKTRYRFGNDFAAAVFSLKLKGKIKLRGQKKWYSGRIWQLDPDLCLEGIDVHGSVINYNGLKNLVVLDSLRYLNLSQCPYIDDWCLNRLYNLAGSLEELSLAGCHQVTERGLACLHHLENLRRLDVSDLPSVPQKGLVRILLEEMMPQCDIVGMEMGAWDEVDPDPDAKAHRDVEAQATSWR